MFDQISEYHILAKLTNNITHHTDIFFSECINLILIIIIWSLVVGSKKGWLRKGALPTFFQTYTEKWDKPV